MAFYQLRFNSEVLNREEMLLVAAPEQIKEETKVVYLLHGGGGGGGLDNTLFLNKKAMLEAWSEEFNVTFIMPSAPDSFFSNTCTGIRYRDYMIKEVMVKMPRLLRISDKRENIATAGMSMGGTSSFMLGMAAPEQIGNICCLCSGNLWHTPLSNRVHSYAVHNVFGKERIEDIEGTEYDFYVDAIKNIQEGKPLPKIFHACGKQDHGLEHAHSTSEWMKSNASAYDYTYYEPEIGAHDDTFFAEWMPKFLKEFTK